MNPSVATELGIMTALRTGDPVRDLALCAAVPLALDRLRETPHTISSLVELAKESMRDVAAGGRRLAYHTVELMEHQGRGGYQPSDSNATDHSKLLMRAINLYLEDHVGLDGYSARYGIFEKSDREALEASLRSEPLVASRQESEIKHLMDSNRELTKLNVSVLPPVGVWVPIEQDVELQYNEVEVHSAAKDLRLQTTRKSFSFRSRADDGPAKMRAFLDRAFAYYLDIEKRKVNEDTTRYMYIRDTGDSADDEEDDDDDDESDKTSPAPCFKRYALGEDKTFDSVFFDEKQAVLKLLDDFTNRSGKFAIEGFPYKLGLLLHGPPGTGKTSLIKAIAQHTKRHLVSISLAKIETNQELLDAMVDLRFKVRGLDLPVKLRFQDVIFVMEDVDCASSVVQARTEASEKTKTAPTSRSDEAENPLAMLVAMLEGDTRPSGSMLASQADKLNLAGLLNVLDGIVDCPGRIVIMTTNHPEKLDPALIRPGRVNKKLRLAWMPPQQIQAMLEYYFGVTLTISLAARVMALRDDRRITPAEVEEICAEFEDVADAVTALESRHHL